MSQGIEYQAELFTRDVTGAAEVPEPRIIGLNMNRDVTNVLLRKKCLYLKIVNASSHQFKYQGPSINLIIPHLNGGKLKKGK